MTSAHLRLSRVSTAIAIALAAAAPALAGPAYIKLGDVKGESTDKGHGSEIEVLSWSWGESRQGKNIRKQVGVTSSDPEEGGEIAGAREPGKLEFPNLRARTGPSVGDMPITKPVDKGTAKLAGPAASGSLIAELPSGTCMVGARYPLVTLKSNDKLYQLSDVTVASCEPVAAARGKKDKAQLEYMHVKMETILVTS